MEVLENLAYLANASNLVLYLSKFMHFSPSSCSNIVSNFMGTAFLLALLGGFLADAFFTTYCIYLISATIELTVRKLLKNKLLQSYFLLDTCINQIAKSCQLWITIYSMWYSFIEFPTQKATRNMTSYHGIGFYAHVILSRVKGTWLHA